MKNATNQATKAKMQQQDKRTRRKQMTEVVVALTAKDGRRFEEAAKRVFLTPTKRVFLTPEELLRALALQAVRESEATGCLTLKQDKRTRRNQMTDQDKRTRRNQMTEVVFPLTTKDGRRFEKVAKRVFLTPEELLRAMAFQAVREIEATGHFTLTHICIPKRLT